MKTVPSTDMVPKSKPKRRMASPDWLHVIAIGCACLFGGGMLFDGAEIQAMPPIEVEIIQPATLTQPQPVTERTATKSSDTIGKWVGGSTAKPFIAGDDR